jgi:hypothetical protein
VIVVSGGAGLGKSVLLSETARAARTRDVVVVHARGRPEHNGRPGATLAAALGQMPSEVPEIADALADRVLLPELVALLVDDAHLADSASLAALAELAEKVGARPILLVVAVRGYLLDETGRRWLDAISQLDDPMSITRFRLTESAPTT